MPRQHSVVVAVRHQTIVVHSHLQHFLALGNDLRTKATMPIDSVQSSDATEFATSAHANPSMRRYDDSRVDVRRMSLWRVRVMPPHCVAVVVVADIDAVAEMKS